MKLQKNVKEDDSSRRFRWQQGFESEPWLQTTAQSIYSWFKMLQRYIGRWWRSRRRVFYCGECVLNSKWNWLITSDQKVTHRVAKVHPNFFWCCWINIFKKGFLLVFFGSLRPFWETFLFTKRFPLLFFGSFLVRKEAEKPWSLMFLVRTKANKTGTSKVGAISKAQKSTIFKFVKGGTFSTFWKSSLLQNIKKIEGDIKKVGNVFEKTFEKTKNENFESLTVPKN